MCSGQGQFVVNHGLLPRGANESRVAPAKGESRELQKMKNSGNEANEYLKTKDITFLDAANYACFACKLTPIEH